MGGTPRHDNSLDCRAASRTRIAGAAEHGQLVLVSCLVTPVGQNKIAETGSEGGTEVIYSLV